MRLFVYSNMIGVARQPHGLRLAVKRVLHSQAQFLIRPAPSLLNTGFGLLVEVIGDNDFYAPIDLTARRRFCAVRVTAVLLLSFTRRVTTQRVREGS